MFSDRTHNLGRGPALWSSLTSSRRIACCRIWKAPVYHRWLGWAQDEVGNGMGSQGLAGWLTLWSPKKHMEHDEEITLIDKSDFSGGNAAHI